MVAGRAATRQHWRPRDRARQEDKPLASAAPIVYFRAAKGELFPIRGEEPLWLVWKSKDSVPFSLYLALN